MNVRLIQSSINYVNILGGWIKVTKQFILEREKQIRHSYSVKFGDEQYWFDVRGDVHKIVQILNMLNNNIETLQKENDELKQEIETLHEQLAHIDGGMFE